LKQQFFCSFCQLPQKVYSRRHVHLLEVVGFAVVGAITTHLVWHDFHWAGILLFCSLTILSEFIYQMRWRLSVKCKSCGFDPLLYKQSPHLAAQEVKTFLEKRKEDPLYLLKPQPKIKPIIKKVKDFKWKDSQL
jgi:hypothetical protein